MNPQSPQNSPYPSTPNPYDTPQQPYQPASNQPYAGNPQTGFPAPQAPNSGGGVRKPSKAWMIIAIIFIVIAVGVAALAVWMSMNYFDQKNNVDSKITAAVATAQKEQADKDAAQYLEKEKQPNREFAGPDDYGHLSFDYPKTWSVFVNKDAAAGGSYEAYLNPGVVPPVNVNTQYALRVLIEQKEYDKVVETYKSLVTKGELKSSTVKLDEETTATRLDGAFTKDIRGVAIIFKIRDKTVTMRSDADTFKNDYEALIKTIKFNK